MSLFFGILRVLFMPFDVAFYGFRGSEARFLFFDWCSQFVDFTSTLKDTT